MRLDEWIKIPKHQVFYIFNLINELGTLDAVVSLSTRRVASVGLLASLHKYYDDMVAYDIPPKPT